jgi:hypothetical protein
MNCLVIVQLKITTMGTCETFISYLARTCITTVGFVMSHEDVEVDEEGFMTMIFEAGKNYPPDDELGHE